MNEVAFYGFWFTAFLTVYSYFIYPLTLTLLPSKRHGKKSEVEATLPSLSVIVAAHNEERRILPKLDNLMALDNYPGGLEIIVASDASFDSTDEIVRRYAGRGVVLVRNDKREGKERAQQLAIGAASGEILIFSDVATEMESDVLLHIVEHFRDPSVGAISSRDEIVDNEGRATGEGAYVRYEMWLRRQESRVGSLVGLSGSFFAVRAAICRGFWSTTVPSDFTTAISCVRQGYSTKLAEDVVGTYRDLANPKAEFPRKVRTILRGMWSLAEFPDVLNPFKFGFFAYQMWCHKVFRWLVPWFLVALLIQSIFLSLEQPFFLFVVIMQILFYSFAIVGQLSFYSLRFAPIRIANYFVLTNLAAAVAGLKFCRGDRVLNWVPSQR